MEGALARLFISYSRDDAAAAAAFAAALGAAGHEVWWDSHIRAGSRFSREIDAALRQAEAVVVLWSPTSIESAWVQDEAAEGLEGGRLVPTLIGQCKPPLGFRQYQTMDLTGWSRGGAVFEPLLAAITAKSGAPAQPPAAPDKTAARLSVCVIPFANMSSDPDQDYFGDGITQDVITDLSNISTLEVVAHDGAGGGKQLDTRDLARRLGVSHVLEGSVRKSGSRLRISAQLIEAATARHVWAERFDRDVSDIFAIQDEIAKAIVTALQLKLLPGEKKAIAERSTSDPQAYDAYLKARQLRTGSPSGDWRVSETIVRLCSQATAADPDYALAWGLLALAQADLHWWHAQATAAQASADRAIGLNPALPEPYCVKARFLEEDGNDAAAWAEVERALNANPDSWDANREAARLSLLQGDPRRAIPFLEKAASVARSDHDSPAMLVICYAATDEADSMRRSAEIALRRAERAVVTNPASSAAFASAARGLAALGQADRARRWLRKAINIDPGNPAMRYSIAATLAFLLHDDEAALDALEPFAEAAVIRPHIRMLEVDPSWGRLRDDDRFGRMVARANRRIAAQFAATDG